MYGELPLLLLTAAAMMAMMDVMLWLMD